MKVVSFNGALENKNALPVQALDKLALALADHNHQWTAEEKLLYEKAIERLTGEKAVQL